MITTEYGILFDRHINLRNFRKTQKGVIYTEATSTGPDLKILLCNNKSVGNTKVCFSDDFQYYVLSFRKHIKNYTHPMSSLLPTLEDMQLLWTLKISLSVHPQITNYRLHTKVVVPLFFNARLI